MLIFVSAYVNRKFKKKAEVIGLEIYPIKLEEFPEKDVEKVAGFICDEFMKINPELKREYYCEFYGILSKKCIEKIDEILFREFSDTELKEYDFWKKFNIKSEN